MAYKKKPKRKLVVESYYQGSILRVRTLRGQWCNADLNVSCASEMEDENYYPAGTKFLVDAHKTSRQGHGEYIFADRDTFKMISDDEVEILLGEVVERIKSWGR